MSSTIVNNISESSEHSTEDNAADNCIGNGGMHATTNALEYEKQQINSINKADQNEQRDEDYREHVTITEHDEEEDEDDEEPPLTNGIHHRHSPASRSSGESSFNNNNNNLSSTEQIEKNTKSDDGDNSANRERENEKSSNSKDDRSCNVVSRETSEDNHDRMVSDNLTNGDVTRLVNGGSENEVENDVDDRTKVEESLLSSIENGVASSSGDNCRSVVVDDAEQRKTISSSSSSSSSKEESTRNEDDDNHQMEIDENREEDNIGQDDLMKKDSTNNNNYSSSSSSSSNNNNNGDGNDSNIKVEGKKSSACLDKVKEDMTTTSKKVCGDNEQTVEETAVYNKSKSGSIVVKKTSQLTEESSPVKIKINGNVIASNKRRLDELEAEQEAGSISSGSECETNSSQDCKRIRFDESIFEEDERERIIREFVERSTDTLGGINKNCEKLQQEIASLLEIARAKELEWNSIMRLLKLKEEMLERIMFKKRQTELNGGKPVDLESDIQKIYKNYVIVAEQSNKGTRSETNTPNNVGMVFASSGGRNTPGPSTLSPASTPLLCGGTAATNSTSVNQNSSNVVSTSNSSSIGANQLDYYKYPTAAAADAYSKLRTTTNRPILPKPPSSIGAIASILEQPVIGEGRKGTILDVKSIIADFRSKNPSDVQPRRGRRVIGLPTQQALSAVASVAAAVSNARLESNAAAASSASSTSVNATHGPARFLGNTSLLSMANLALGSGSHVRTSVTSTTHQDHPTPSSFLLGPDGISSSLKQDAQLRGIPGVVASNMDTMIMSSGPISASSQHSFQEALVKFARMNERKDSSPSSSTSSGGLSNNSSTANAAAAAAAAIMHQQQHHHQHQQQQQILCQSSGKSSQHLPPPPPYPEVTLHPVIVPQTTAANPTVQNSLLHGILTKSNNQQQQQASQAIIGSGSAIQHRPTTFSPTLARLLTAPERNSRMNRNPNVVAAATAAVGNTSLSRVQTKSSALTEILNSKRTKSEVTITPVSSSTTCNSNKIGSDVIQLDEDEELDDRLVIDESRDSNVMDSTPNVIPADQVPECQGCHKKAAQFVCAGCGNQWYCSRECQVQAWEDHSEMCSG